MAEAAPIPGTGPATCGSSQTSTSIRSRRRWRPALKPCRLRLLNAGITASSWIASRSSYSSVSIRRLEACLGTEVLPANPVDVRSCLAAGNW